MENSRTSSVPKDPKYVVRPNRVQGLWLHWPGLYKNENQTMQDLPINMGFMFHFRNWTFVNYIPIYILYLGKL